MQTLITFAGVTFNTGVPDGDGCYWKMSVPQGWGAPVQQVDILEPTAMPGGSQGNNRGRPRPLAAKWMVRAPSAAAAWTAYQHSLAMPGFGLDRQAVLQVNEPEPKWLTVIQTAADIKEPRGNLLVFADVELSALDPYKRGVEQHTQPLAAGATVSVMNAGNVAATLSLTTTGSGTVVVRQNGSGQVLRTRASVASGTTFDGTGRSVTTAGGLDIFPMGAPSEWLSIPAASTVTLTNLGTAPVDASWYDLYA